MLRAPLLHTSGSCRVALAPRSSRACIRGMGIAFSTGSGRQARAAPLRAMATDPQEQKEEAGHKVPAGSVVAEDAIDPEILAYQQHQKTAARLSLAEEARTLVAGAKFGVLSTITASGDLAGFPGGSAVEFAADTKGRPVFAFSSLSPHTGDVRNDPRVSFTVLAEGFRGISDARVNLIGRMAALSEEEKEAMRELYKARHPSSFWVDFGDFSWWRLEEVLQARVVGGFARAGKVTAEEYAAAEPDPIAPFSAPVSSHMNEDHADATIAMVKHYVGITVDSAAILNLDRLGMNVSCTRKGDAFKARLPFPRPATDRKSVKDLIVEMTRAAAAAAAAGNGSKE